MTEDTGEQIHEFTEQTLLGELMATCLEEIKAAPDVWQKIPQAEQDEVINRVECRCRAAVRQAVDLIAAQGRVTIRAEVEQVVFKDGIKAVLTAHRGQAGVHDLADAQGEQVQIVLADAEQFMGGAEDVQSDPDQPEIPLEDEPMQGAQ